MEAFGLALKLGATGLESDVWRTSDGVLVLDHDGVVRRGLRRRPLTATPRSELPPHIPDLADVLERCADSDGDPVALSLDLKGPGTGAAVVDLIRTDFPDLAGFVWCCHPEVDELIALRRLDDDIRLVNSTRLERIAEGPERRAARLNDAGIDGINLHHTDVNGGLVAMFHRFRRTLFAWDLQFEPALRAVLRMGVDAVYSDWVDRMMDAYRAELGSPRLPDGGSPGRGTA